MTFLSDVIWGNTLGTWLTGVGVALVTAAVLRVLVPRLIRRAKTLARSTSTYLDDALVDRREGHPGFCLRGRPVCTPAPATWSSLARSMQYSPTSWLRPF